MKILPDECVPRKLKPHLANHICRTASEAGFSGKKNGVLLRLAEAEGYDVLITIDRGMETQQNLAGRRISILILRGNLAGSGILFHSFLRVSKYCPGSSPDKFGRSKSKPITSLDCLNRRQTVPSLCVNFCIQASAARITLSAQ
jgi:hypothetical protein